MVIVTLGRMGRRRALCILAATLALLGFVWPALASPPVASSFWGTVRVDGQLVPEGTVVSAWSAGRDQPWRETVTDARGLYLLDVQGDDPETPAVEGPTPGTVLQFRIQTGQGTIVMPQTGTWFEARDTELNLSVLQQASTLYLPFCSRLVRTR